MITLTYYGEWNQLSKLKFSDWILLQHDNLMKFTSTSLVSVHHPQNWRPFCVMCIYLYFQYWSTPTHTHAKSTAKNFHTYFLKSDFLLIAVFMKCSNVCWKTAISIFSYYFHTHMLGSVTHMQICGIKTQDFEALDAVNSKLLAWKFMHYYLSFVSSSLILCYSI